MAEYLSDDQIDALIGDRMREEAAAFLSLGTLFESRVTFITRGGRTRCVPTTDGGVGDNEIVALTDAAARDEPAALMHAYWMSDLDGPGSGIIFAVEVHVEDGCAAYVWLADDFEWEGDGTYSPSSTASLTPVVSFDDADTENDSRLAAWPWTLDVLADWVFGAAEA